MITRLYADNYKTLVNFELSLGPINLLLGANGSGKSNVLETIRLIWDFVSLGSPSGELFPANSRCRWDARKVQTFEIDLCGEEGTFAYKLEIEHGVNRGSCRVKSELLTHNQRPIYISGADGAQVYEDDGITTRMFLFDENRSGIRHIPDYVNKLSTRFRRRLSMVWSLYINPFSMTDECETENAYPSRDMSNFASWYQNLALDRPTVVSMLTEVLKTGVLDGFRSLRLMPVGEKTRALQADFGVQANNAVPETVASYRFSELSDGQRSLIALYALATCASDEQGTICLDHPENHLALPEIHPWLMRLSDATDDGKCQAIIATHHPMLINLLAAHSGYWLERQSDGPTRVKKITQDQQDSSGLSLSELIARGWLYE
ncbi:MAG: AAA family ATPase [Planctomycetes bacterium]|nr:AAA family ATPase [Planctomycetota bacterium]